MPADVDSEHFFFKSKARLFGVLSDIRQFDLKLTLLVVFHQIEQRHLPSHRIFLLLAHMLHDPDIDAHKLFSRSAETVQRSGFDKALDHALVHRIFHRDPRDKIFQILKRTKFLPILYDHIDDRTSHAFDRHQTVPDAALVHGKIRHAAVDVRRQDLNVHMPACINIFCHFRRIFNHGSHQRRHKFYRIIVFQKCGLIRHDRVCSGMGFIERILGKIDHFIIDLVRRLLIDPVFDTSRNAVLFVAINKDLALFLHHIRLFLRHRTAEKIASPERIPRQIPHDLHHLFLIHDTAVSRRKDRF